MPMIFSNILKTTKNQTDIFMEQKCDYGAILEKSLFLFTKNLKYGIFILQSKVKADNPLTMGRRKKNGGRQLRLLELPGIARHSK